MNHVVGGLSKKLTPACRKPLSRIRAGETLVVPSIADHEDPFEEPGVRPRETMNVRRRIVDNGLARLLTALVAGVQLRMFEAVCSSLFHVSMES